MTHARDLARLTGGAGEKGQALVLFVLGLAAFCGLVGLAIDGGQIVATRTDLQKTADAAALAAAQDLPTTSAARSTADAYVLDNGGVTTTSSVVFSQTSTPNDTVTVTVTRPVTYSFLRVLGLGGTTVSASATAAAQVVTGFAFDDVDIFPYAVWGGNPVPPGGCPYNICAGDTEVYRSNAYRNQSVCDGTPGCPWQVNGNNFKGYFHHGTGITEIDPSNWQTFSSGGNAIGQEPTSDLDDHVASGEPILVPVIAEAECTGGCGTIRFKIVAWVALKLDPRGNASQDWTGTVVGNYSTPHGATGGSHSPPSDYPAVYTLGLTN
jgi:hypothetical protein